MIRTDGAQSVSTASEPVHVTARTGQKRLRRVPGRARPTAFFLLGVSVPASAIAALRPDIGGLLLHPYLFVLAYLGVVGRTSGALRRTPERLVLPLAFFIALFCATSLQASQPLPDIVK